MKVIFLDVDGVLNGHQKLPGSKFCGIDPACMARLNHTIRETGASIVLSSSWRYLVHSGTMTLAGLNHLFTTHGLVGAEEPGAWITLPREASRPQEWRWPIIDVTHEDLVVNDPHQRGKQIAWWVQLNPVESYVAIDDMDLGHTVMGISLVLTDGTVGITDRDVDRAIRILLNEEDFRSNMEAQR